MDPHLAFKRALTGYRCLGFVGEGQGRQALWTKGDRLKSLGLSEILDGELILKAFTARGVVIGATSDPTFQQEVTLP
jgi:hypothetical protein